MVPASTCDRILDATLVAVARYGRKCSMSEIADEAGVSRPTLYRYYATKEALLDALAEHEQRRFDEQLVEALRDARTREQRLDAAIRFVIDFADRHPGRALVDVEPRFMLQRLAASLEPQSAALERTLGDALAAAPMVRSGAATTSDLSLLIVRTAMMSFLVPPADNRALLRTLRAMVGVRAKVVA
jgi:AcrR family transcriptional regulator